MDGPHKEIAGVHLVTGIEGREERVDPEADTLCAGEGYAEFSDSTFPGVQPGGFDGAVADIAPAEGVILLQAESNAPGLGVTFVSLALPLKNALQGLFGVETGPEINERAVESIYLEPVFCFDGRKVTGSRHLPRVIHYPFGKEVIDGKARDGSFTNITFGVKFVLEIGEHPTKFVRTILEYIAEGATFKAAVHLRKQGEWPAVVQRMAVMLVAGDITFFSNPALEVCIFPQGFHVCLYGGDAHQGNGSPRIPECRARLRYRIHVGFVVDAAYQLHLLLMSWD